MQAKYNIQGRSFKQYCRGKAIRVTYCQCVSVALVIQHAMRMLLNCHLWSV